MAVHSMPASLALVLVLVLAGQVSLDTSDGGLYTDKDHVLVLNGTNFAENVFNKERVFILHFYKHYCGYCIRFAPKWKGFATAMKRWSKVVAPAVIDCANPDNVPTCRDYQIPQYPSVKMLGVRLSAADLGTFVVDHYDLAGTRHELVDLVTGIAKQPGPPKHWPNLEPVREQAIYQVWRKMPRTVNSFLLVIEQTGSYLGREIILDFSSYNVSILRMEQSNKPLYTELASRLNIKSLPALVRLSLHRKAELLWQMSGTDLDEARAEVRADIHTALGIPEDEDEDGKDDEEEGQRNHTTPARVQMVDLENALNGILRQEIATKSVLSGEVLRAFKTFLGALTKYFPGRAPVMNFLFKLNAWVSSQNVAINMKHLQNAIDSYQRTDSVLPPMRSWVGCKGSQSKFRGYTCGLWTIFHAMTVQAYNAHLKGSASRPQEVLMAIRDYVINFFDCSGCAQHFQSMASDLESQVSNANDTVLWLWQAHNKVNRRLKGDDTEDPWHPKVQFPPSSLCAECREIGSDRTQEWNVPNTLLFLNELYDKKHISLDGTNV